MSGQVRVLLVSGSTRRGSANTAALATTATVAPDGVTTVSYDGLAGLPAFNPDDDGDRLPAAAIGPDGTVTDPQVTAEIARVWDALLAHLGQPSG